ncbi:MAG TPA: hypothetical protein VK213_01255 [Bacteroidales bacterium]|nr:hypothetical protein [Bacteroidales bacterium]
MYHVIGTVTVLSVLYLISFLFYRTGLFSRQFHWHIWNSVLAVTFILTALAGVFLALQVNYKWDVPYIEKILKYHVETGAALAFTSIIHLVRHFSFYTGIFKPGVESGFDKVPSDIVKNIRTNLFLIGFVSSSMQLLLLREIMNITGGYELISGIFLGSWLLASSAGSALSGRSNMNNQRKLNFIFSASPVISVVLLIIMSRLFLGTGQTPSFLLSLVFILIISGPFCIVSGFIFIKLLNLAASSENLNAGRSFSIETAGGVVSGIIVSIMTSGFLNTYQIIFLITILYSTWVIINFTGVNKTAIKLLALIIASVLIVFNTDIAISQLLIPGLRIDESIDTPYGNISYGTYNGEKSTYYNHRLISNEEDVIEREENIHYAMLQTDKPETVIQISGLLTSQAGEFLKYNPSKIIHIERDPLLSRVDIADSLKAIVQIEEDDALRYIRKNKEQADVIISLVPPPSTLQLNRYFTTEFFREVKNSLNVNGIFMCSPGTSETYFNPQSLALYSSVYKSLKASFKNVLPVAGNKLYFVASDKQLSASFCLLTQLKDIQNIYVGCDYLYDDITGAKSQEIVALMDTSAKENKIDFPVASLGYQNYIFSKEKNANFFSYILLIVLFALPGVTLRKKKMLMYSGAAALSGFEIIILLMIQSNAGNMYHITGLVIAAMMGGLSLGALSSTGILKGISLLLQCVTLIIFYALFALLSGWFLKSEAAIFSAGILILTSMIPAFITGNLFSRLTGSGREEKTFEIYSADLAGSALGFVVLSAISLPAIGIQNSLFLICMIVISGTIFGSVKFSK